jgi:hypothetical protein
VAGVCDGHGHVGLPHLTEVHPEEVSGVAGQTHLPAYVQLCISAFVVLVDGGEDVLSPAVVSCVQDLTCHGTCKEAPLCCACRTCPEVGPAVNAWSVLHATQHLDVPQRVPSMACLHDLHTFHFAGGPRRST